MQLVGAINGGRFCVPVISVLAISPIYSIDKRCMVW